MKFCIPSGFDRTEREEAGSAGWGLLCALAHILFPLTPYIGAHPEYHLLDAGQLRILTLTGRGVLCILAMEVSAIFLIFLLFASNQRRMTERPCRGEELSSSIG